MIAAQASAHGQRFCSLATHHQVQQTEDADDKLTALGRGILHNDIVEVQERCRQWRYGDDNARNDQEGNAREEIAREDPGPALGSTELHQQQRYRQQLEKRIESFPSLKQCHIGPQHPGNAQQHQQNRQSAGGRQNFPAKFVPAKDGNQCEEPEAYENGGGRR